MSLVGLHYARNNANVAPGPEICRQLRKLHVCSRLVQWERWGRRAILEPRMGHTETDSEPAGQYPAPYSGASHSQPTSSSTSSVQNAHGQPRTAPEPVSSERSSASCCTSSASTTSRHRTYCAKLQSPNCTADPSSATLSASTSQSLKRATGRRAYCANLQPPNCTADAGSATFSASTACAVARCASRRTTTNSPTGSAASAGAASSATSRI